MYIPQDTQMNTMVDRPIFAFEPSFLDRLPHQYDRNLDPTSEDDVMMETSNDETRDDEDRMEINETDEFLKRPIPQRVPTAASSRVASGGSVNTAGSNSLWFLRKQHQHQRTSKRSTSGSSQFIGGPSVNSFFSFPPTSMNSLNSLGSLSSINSFLKGIGGSSVDSLKGFGASMDSLGIVGTSEDVSAMEDAPSTGIIRQVTPEEYRGRNRYHDTAATTTSTPTSVMMRTSTSTPSSFSHHPLYPDAPAASAKSAATLINLYSQANNKKESNTITSTTTTTAMVKQPVPTFLDGTGATAIPANSKAATPSTKAKSKRVAAKKSTKSKNTSQSQPKKRIRRKEPVVRKYVVANEKDVLLGRGGGSNHHPGNIAYRQEILRLQPEYKLLDRDAKTAMSEQVVQWVLQQKQGRFLKRECKASPWYIVTDATARQKVSQALREDHTPEGRALKKSRTTYKAPKKSRKKN